ncbi:bifunctional UDP-sugar hydrolase/5'-nucleotidase UshA [Aeromonas caviae]|uniref:bifunctional UDP-sugar hydrolase/5'-nucleotidase UshA n=1 Tax=Aeromonas TaxID=642 RepID=UPI000CDDE8CF|nr:MULTISPECIES: bifunctional UDP-sugar hydrolase/5'-nucleotidase UshA [Aeromonas]MBA8783875.1 bifunctional UDP-sugar hydrolase/5'-nucleotidase [Aeromonas caviae]MBA8787872.1 bifunctional UDP-sugar hydrolase/5'-nucleotidase [Aeromonas sp. TW 6]MDH0237651.1 bifunctional UDP-sugar hydrolase/5'-nucleotidase UshA [Aeromonas caviae]MDX7598817.1 bifunctional UDP-sugar hydrolase/5'-nucleotidase UshA [Aeromonas caviae]MDX7682055.1 bifunctional UDP-sugar hydrolase/5'-nucleotidase UshA [Aeromonas caviae
MNYKFVKGSIALAVLAALSGCNTSSNDSVAPCTENVCKLTILHTNDTHGRFWHNDKGEYGMAAQKTLVERLRAEAKAAGSEVLVLSGGDVNTGVPESDLQDAEPDFMAMNSIRYDAMAVGNHEFDNPLTILEKQRQWAQFPMISANIYDKTSGKRYFDPYKVFKLESGLKVAVLGLTTEDTAQLVDPNNVQTLEFRDPTTEAANLGKQIRDNKEANLVLAITHMGHYENGQHGSNAPGDVEMARALPAGTLDAIIGGHSQNPVCMEPGTPDKYADFKPGDDCQPDQQNGTWIMQAHEWGKYVGRAQFDYQNGKLTLTQYDLIPVNLKNADGDFIQEEIVKDPELYNTLLTYQEKGQQELGVVIGATDGVLDGERANVRNKQTNLGRLITTATAEKLSTDFGIVNSGGVRASIAAGDISYRDVLTVHPFGNTVNKATMSGNELLTYLGQVATKTANTGGYAQFGGIKMTVDCQAKSVDIATIGGKAFDPAATYSFSIPSFSAAGGDGYPKIDTINAGLVDAGVLKDYIAAKKIIQVADYQPAGEVSYINSTSVEGCK